MAIQTDYSSSTDFKLNQFLKWDDTEQWIEITHTINLAVGLKVVLISSKTYYPGQAKFDELVQEFGLNPANYVAITEYKYHEKHGDSDSDHAIVLPTDGKPYNLGRRPHFVIVRLYDINANLTSTTSGTAL